MARYRSFDAAISGEVQVIPPIASDLDDVRLRRAGLKAALSGLELALAAPAPNRAEWVTGVREALAALHEVWTRHMCETEAPGAFLDELVAEAPRLSKPASRLRREHNDTLATIVRSEKQVLSPPSTDDLYDAWADATRAELTTLLVALARHRQRGA